MSALHNIHLRILLKSSENHAVRKNLMDPEKISKWNLLVFIIAICIAHAATSLVGTLNEVTYQGPKFVKEGKPLTITCQRWASGASKWMKNGVFITVDTNDSRLHFQNETVNNFITMELNITSAQMEDRGQYKCDALSPSYHKVEVVPLKETDKKRTTESVLLTDENLKLNCSIAENSAFPINWFKDNNRILELYNPRFKLSGQSLIISNPTEMDAGDYLCNAEISELSHPVPPNKGHLIQVTYVARVEKFPHQIRPILGRDLTLECKVHGYPVPRIAWFIDDEPVEIFMFNRTSRLSILDNSEGLPNAIFFIQNVTYEDGYQVTCLAENFQGSMSTSVVLAIRENMISTNEEYPGKGIVLLPGSRLELQCNTTDDPLPVINWFKNGHPINSTDIRINLGTPNTLNISHTTEDDAGSYVCVTEDESVNATIVVRTKVKLWPFEYSRNVVQGQNVFIYCNVTQGKPTPTLQWFKDKEPLNMSDDRISIAMDKKGIANSQLTIKETDFNDRAEYTCIATNEVGSVNGTTLVRIKDKYAALWPFLGICAEVAILCTIIFIYEKKRQKPDFDESDADHNTENKNVPDQEEKSQDVRQRK